MTFMWVLAGVVIVVVVPSIYACFYSLLDVYDFRRRVLRQLYPDGMPWEGVTTIMATTEIYRLKARERTRLKSND